MTYLTDMRNRKKTTATIESYNRTLDDLRNIFLNVTIGDYSSEVIFPKTENSQTEMYFGVKLMYDTIREKISEIEKLKLKYENQNESKNDVLQLISTNKIPDNEDYSLGNPNVVPQKNTNAQIDIDTKSVQAVSGNWNLNYTIDKTESRCQMILDSLDTSLVLADKNGNIELVNDSFLKLFGFQMDEVIGSSLNTLIIQSNENDPKQFEINKFNSRKEITELKLRKKNGDAFWTQIHKIPLTEKQESIFIFNDINKLKFHENKINVAADLSRENPNPLLRYSISEQRFVSGNKAAKYLLKYFRSINNLNTFGEIQKMINQFYETKKIAQEEIKVNKQTFLFTFVSDKNKKYVNIYGNDLTAIKKAESEIRRLLFILSKTDNSVIIADKHGLIQWVNDGFERLCGYKLNEVKGTSGSVLRKGKSNGLNTSNPYFNRILKTKQSVSYETKNYTKDGTEYWAYTTFTPILDAEGEIDCIVAVDSDITMKKRVEKQMLLAMQFSAESAKAKQNFLANMSHEIRTPMNGIMGIIQLLRDTPLDAKQKEYLKSMEFAGENLLSIVNDVLDLSKIDSGKMKLEKMVFDPKALIRELINSMAHRANEKFLNLIVNIDKNMPPALISDPLRLNQILINLLSNSIKFTDEGEISITINFETTNEGSLLKMTVKDTGIGIPKEKQQIIFDEFEQAHNGNKRLFSGTGLGLSIVKKLVGIMNGKMMLNSTLGIGTEFNIIIPVEVAIGESENKETVDPDNSDKQIIYKKKLLLVEDNKLNQMVAERFLAKMGAKVTIAENGLEAIRILKSDDFDAILMDIQMPEMNGYETTKFIREKLEKRKRNIPILAMTAHALAGEEQNCIDAGMNDYISKPIIRENLEKMLINIFKKYGNQIR